MTHITTGSSNTLEPWISLKNGTAALAFYKAAFNAEESNRMDSDDNGFVVKLSVGAAAFWLSSEGSSTEAQEAPGSTVRFILTVDDPDTFFANALRTGATEVYAVEEQYGWRIGRLIDVAGLHWEIGKPIA